MTPTYQSWDGKYWFIENTDYASQILKKFKYHFDDFDNKIARGVTNTHKGDQVYFQHNEALDVEEFLIKYVNKLFKDAEMPYVLEDNPFQIEALDRPALMHARWKIRYESGGWQGAHQHQTGADEPGYTMISVVMYFSNPGLEVQDGSLYTIFPEKDGMVKNKVLNPSAGKVVVMSGNLFHGTYPTTTQRDIIVMDFVAKKVSNES